MTARREVHRPASLSQAVAMAGPGTRFLAGGTDIVPALRDGKFSGMDLVDLSALQGELGQVRLEGRQLCIGAMATMAACRRDPLILQHLAPLAAAAGAVGSPQIRGRATVGGNLVHASPAADTAPVLVAAGALVSVQSQAGCRRIPVESFLLGPNKNALEPGELVVEILIPLPEGGYTGSFQKWGKRAKLTIAVVNAAVLKSEETGHRVAYGAVAPRVARAQAVEQALNRGDFGAELEQAVSDCIAPIDDVRASARYRRHICLHLTREALAEMGRQEEAKT